MTLEGDRAVDPPINNGIESHNTDSQCFPEAQTEKKKKKKSRKNKDSSIDIHVDTSGLKDGSAGTNSCHDSLVSINDAQRDLKIETQWNPEAQCPHPKKKSRKKRMKDKDASVDIHAHTSKFQEDSIGPNSCRNNNSLESHNTDSQCNPEAKYPQPKKKKSKKRRKDKDTQKDDSIGTKSCHDSLAEINAHTESKTATISVMSRNYNSLESHNLDSQCNSEAESQRPKKRKRKRRLKDEDASAALPVLSRNNNSLESHNTDSQCNPESEYPQPKKKKSKKRLKEKDALIDIHSSTATQKDDSIGTNSCHDYLAEFNAHTEPRTAELSVLSKNYNSSESHSIDSQCNSEAKCPQPKKKKRKKKMEDKDASIDIHVDTSRKSNSLESHNIDSQCNPEAECPKPKKKKRKKKLRGEDASVDFHADTSKLKDGSNGTKSCHDSSIEIDAQIESKSAALPVLSGNSNLESHDIDSQCNPETKCPEPMKNKRHRKLNNTDTSSDIHIGTSKLKDDSVGTYSCCDSLVETIGQTDSQNKRKKKRKKKRLNSSGITDEVHATLADLDLTVTEENALISEKQGDSPESPGAGIVNKRNGDAAPSVVGKENIKKKRKKRKLDSSIIYDNAHHAHADRNVVGIEGDGKQNDPRSPSINMVEENYTNDDGAFILNGNENVKKKRKRDKKKLNTSVIIDKALVTPEEVDRSDEKNALMFVKEIDSQSTPSSNQTAGHIEGELRSYSRKRRRSPDSRENMQPTAVAGEVTSNSKEIHPTKISNNEVEGVQDGKVAASSNVLADKNSFDYSNVDFPCPESKDMIEIKKSSGLNVSIEKDDLHQLAHPPVGAHVEYTNKKLLILDVNGLLADVVPYTDRKYKHDIVVSKKYVFKRPFCDNFLQFCFEKFNVGVWSSRLKTNLYKIVNFLMPDSRHKLLFCWDQSHCTNTGFTTTNNSSKPLFLKELKKLWDKLEPGLPWNKGEFNESNTLLLDDSPYKALSNPANTAIFPHSYDHKNTEDSSLGPGGELRVYLEKLAQAPNIQEYVAHNPFGQKAITELNDFHQKVLRSVSENESSVKIASSSEPS